MYELTQDFSMVGLSIANETTDDDFNDDDFSLWANFITVQDVEDVDSLIYIFRWDWNPVGS